MTQCWAFLVQSWLWLGVLHIFAQKVTIRNTGKCDYAKDVELHFVCKNSVTQELYYRWGDKRAPQGVEYSVWQTPSNQPGLYVILVSFHASELAKVNVITVEPKRYKIKGKKLSETEFEYVPFTHSDMHCFNISLRYFNDLRATCTNKKYKPDEEAIKNGILHYARLQSKKRGASTRNTINLIVLLPALLIVPVHSKYVLMCI